MENLGPSKTMGLSTFKCDDDENEYEDNLSCEMTESPTTTQLDKLRTKALGIYVVFSNIMSHLPQEEVQWNCSLVNKHWNSSVTSYLQKWALLKILIRDWGDPKLPVGLTERVGLGSEEKPRRIRWISVEQLEEKLQSSSRTKRISLLLRYLGQENENKVIRRCITLVSPWVTKLTIHDTRKLLYDPRADINQDLNTVYIHGDTMPNLTHLCMGKFSFKQENVGPKIPFLHPGTMERIKTVEFNSDYACSYNYAVSLLNACPNVAKIVSLSLSDPSKSLHTSMRDNMDLFQKFGAKFYKLTHLALGAVRDWPDWTQIFSQLLQNNRHTLERLEIWPLFSPQLLTIPPLEKLTTLALLDNGRREGKFFSPHFDLAGTFPGLVNFEISTISSELIYVKELWPADFYSRQMTNLVCLKKLTLRNESRPSIPILHHFAYLFPSIETLVVETDAADFVNPFLTTIWEMWPNLTELTVKIEWCKSRHHGRPNVNFCLDSTITGISQHECHRLRTQNEVEDLETVKVFPGISDMHNLTKFTISVYWDDRSDGRSAGWKEPYAIVSRVAALYGFQRVPDLVVKLTNHIPYNYSQRKKQIVEIWENIKPYVSVDYFTTRD